MGRHIFRCLIGTSEECLQEADSKHGPLYRIENSDVYWGEDGTLAIIAEKEWADYLAGRTQEIPRHCSEEETCDFKIEDNEFLELMHLL